jgi:hypothetical protein
MARRWPLRPDLPRKNWAARRQLCRLLRLSACFTGLKTARKKTALHEQRGFFAADPLVGPDACATRGDA